MLVNQMLVKENQRSCHALFSRLSSGKDAVRSEN